jgi:hypothetical protein
VSEFLFSASQKRKLEHVRLHLEEKIAAVYPPLLKSYPIEPYIEQLDLCERGHGYRFVPPGILRLCDEISALSGLRGLELYNKALLVALIENHEHRQRRYRIPDAILSLIPQEFDRILSGIETAEDGFHLHRNDLFAKDLGLCRLKLLPCGSEVVDLWSGVPRSTLLHGGGFQLLQGAMFFTMRLGGFKPLYESHWDRRLVRHFTAQQYDLCYVRIARLLELNPEVKGMFGASWWYDPHLENIAPELLFLSKTPVENGARIFHVGPDAYATKDATQFSKKRKALYESGEFMPSRYMLVWARSDMLDWANRFAASEKQQLI